MLGREGHDLTLVGRSPEKLEAAVGSLRREGLRVVGGEADVASEGDVPAVVRIHETRYGSLDVLVNSAGMPGLGPIEGCPTKLLDQLLTINLRALILFYRECLDLLRSSGAERPRPTGDQDFRWLHISTSPAFRCGLALQTIQSSPLSASDHPLIPPMAKNPP